ncbi:hypothetical protein F2P45_18685 [Massilia sp. CCM 8733]|uniref:Secreted protein n=1 Tax=Massilia mucilaginosa TaxID=2609282 RepID=A0ABX0NVQ2_9BURK|nr:hypothetical protein [Massilia mucilaginosa]NHZ91029.1 hypothetical protein [Massilia mucilaginosa]
MDTQYIRNAMQRMTGAVVGALLCSTLALAPAHAGVLTGMLVLDGNTADPSGAAPPDDWESFPANQANTVRATGIVADTVPAVFRNGSKDTLDIGTWRYDLGSSPPKTDMKNGYAAAYSNAGDLIINFGADRDSFSGTASLGFWFFKNPVVRNDATGTFINPVTGQPATHADGDVLVAFEYSNGGAVTTVRIFKWQAGALADQGSIGVGPTSVAGVYCDPADRVCGATNNTTLNIPWAGTVQPGQFFEGGINITKLLPGSDSCFSTFMATSRSSAEPNASIKNFIIASFPVCRLEVTTVCEGSVFQAATNTVLNTLKGRITNEGGGTVTSVSVSSKPAFIAGTVGFFTCDAGGSPTTTPQSPASLAAGGAICFRGQYSSNTLTTLGTVTAAASTGSGSITDTDSATCTTTPPGGLAVTKVCDVDLVAQNNQLVVKINYSGSVTNTGAYGLTDVKVCESAEVAPGVDPCSVAGHTEIAIGNLDAGAVKAYSSSYFPNQALNGQGLSTLGNPEAAIFKDKVSAKGTRPVIVGGGVLQSPATEAACPLCK